MSADDTQEHVFKLPKIMATMPTEIYSSLGLGDIAKQIQALRDFQLPGELSQQIESLTKVQKDFSASLGVGDVAKQIQALMDCGLPSELSQPIKTFTEAQKNIGSMLGLDDLGKQMAGLKGFQLPSELSRQIENLAKVQRDFGSLLGLKDLTKQIEALKDFKLPAEFLEIASEQARNAATSAETETEANEVLAKINEAVVESQKEGGGLGTLFSKLLSLTEKEPKHWLLRTTIKLFIDNLMKFVFGLIAWYAYQNSDTPHDGIVPSPQSIEKPQVKAAKALKRVSKIDASFRSYRVVERDCMVMSRRTRHSEVLFVLCIGDFIMVKQKVGKWILVEWTDPDSHMTVEGWAKSKYLFRQ